MARSKFIRKCKIELTSVNEAQSFDLWGSSGLDSLRGTAGREKGLYDARIAFEVSKSREGIYTNAHIRLFNIRLDVRDQIREKSEIKLYAGYLEDFEKGTDQMTPIFQGEIYHIDTQLYIDSEVHLYCFSGGVLLHNKMPSVQLKTASTKRMLFRQIRAALSNSSLGINILGKDGIGKDELENIVDGYDNDFTRRGFTANSNLSVRDFFDQITANISVKDTNEVK